MCVITLQEALHRDLPVTVHKQNKTKPEKFTLPDCSYEGTAEDPGLVLA